MRLINLSAELVQENCTGCTICVKVCPTLAIGMVHNATAQGPKQLPEINLSICVGCGACEQRCPFEALRMVRRPTAYTVGVSQEGVDPDQVRRLCQEAHFNPEQIVCFCTGTRAEEVAAAILKGYRTPEELSHHTGIRTGCKVECTQPLLRLLEAAEVPFKPTLKNGWQLYGRTITAWEVSAEVKTKYASRGFYFDEDLQLMNKITYTQVKEAVKNAPAD
jgi:ferredoxin